ncbi:hypothetical protein CTI12_AA349480 [Artemisia annua]|uniref:Uncharacterized protein n=1 Tax=Artemisia annua TaxID=35608 RepID=A0A2U1MQ96_ARTAN|nr:hypothetical protein CTI12_AA349480 [Artemisia annua]
MDQGTSSGSSALRLTLAARSDQPAGVYVTELSRTWGERLHHETSYYGDIGEMTLLMQDTTEMTLETNNLPLDVDPSGHPPDVGGLDDQFWLMNCQLRDTVFIGSSGGPSTSVGVSRSS